MNMAFNGLRFVTNLGIRTIRTSTRPFLDHPFIVAGSLFVIFLYRSSPFLFSLLVSASPIVVCTAVLLGTLLSYGDAQILESEKSLSAVPLQNHTTEAVTFSRHDPNIENVRQISVTEREIGGLSSWRSWDFDFDKQRAEESSNGYKMLAIEATTSMDGYFESSSLPWTRVSGDEERNVEDAADGDDDEEYEPLDSGEDGAESSSPEASMADIIPLLDEIDPLIKSENSALLCTRSRSLNSNECSMNSDEEGDDKEAEEEEDDEEEAENENEEENEGNKEDGEESAIKWTEVDQKNLMDLGSSELERNQRLESLIARRRARRSMNERNLIDLDGNGIDLPSIQLLTISTTRQNPFDFPDDSYDDKGLPPIPGSAPSILVPRRNPFDLPYDLSEEKPDLTGDSFHQEFMQQNHKEPVLRRHESFNIGSSSLAQFPKKDGRLSRLRPYFVASEGVAFSSLLRQSSEVSESSSSYQRQSSDVSESKASSVAETEQVSVQETVPESEKDQGSVYVEHGSQSSQILDQFEDRDIDLRMPEIRLGESETRKSTSFNQAVISFGSSGNDPNIETWLATNLDIELMESVRSSSSSSSLSVEEEEENNDVKDLSLDFVEIYNDLDEKLMEASGLEQDLSTLEMLEAIEEHISSSSSSVVSEDISNMADIKPEIDNSSDVPIQDVRILDMSSSIHTMDLEEPVYDSSPRASKFAESDCEQETVSLLGKNDRDKEEVSVSVDTNKLNLSADLLSVSPEEPQLVDEDGVLPKEKLISVAHEPCSPEDDALTNLNSTHSQQKSSDISEKTRLEVEESELGEIIDKPRVDIAEEPSPDVAFI